MGLKYLITRIAAVSVVNGYVNLPGRYPHNIGYSIDLCRLGRALMGVNYEKE